MFILTLLSPSLNRTFRMSPVYQSMMILVFVMAQKQVKIPRTVAVLWLGFF